MLAIGGHFLFTAKPSSHKTLYSWLDGAEVPAMEQKVKQGARFVTHRYRWLEDVPLRDGKDAMLVNWLEIEIVDPAGKITYRNSFVTDLAVIDGQRRRARGLRPRALEDRERELQHAEDQGLQPRAQLRPRPAASGGGARHHEPAGIRHAHRGRSRRRRRGLAARAAVGARKRFFEDLRAITTYLVFPTWAALVETLRTGQPPPAIRDG